MTLKPLKTWGLLAGGLFITGMIGINGLAIMHGRAMTTLVSQNSESNESNRTRPPEELGILAKSKVLLTGVELPRPAPVEPPPQFTELGLETHYYPSPSGHTLESWYLPPPPPLSSTPLAEPQSKPASPASPASPAPFAPLAERQSKPPHNLFILFHPYGSSKISMVAIAQELYQMGYGVMLVDFYGSGGSSGTTTSIGYFEALDVVASVDYARDQWHPDTIQLYGASMGGAAVLRAVAVHDVEVEAIAIESAFDSLLNTVKNRFDVMGLPSTPLAELLTFWGGQQRNFNAFHHAPNHYAKQISTPTLLLHGQNDQRVTQNQAEAIYQNLQGWKHFSLYPGGGHGSSYHNNPTQWRNDLQRLKIN